MARDIFLKKNVVCPVCKSPSEAQYPNPRLYAAGNKDSDMRVTSYRWAEGAETSVLPHYYAVWQCPNCMFADLADEVFNPKGASMKSRLHNAFGDIGMEQKLVLASLKKLQTQGEMSHDNALSAHLTALFISELPPKEDRNHNKIGRLALRVGWLYREVKGDTVSEESDSVVLQGLMDRSNRMEKHLLTVRELLGEVNDFADRRVSELGMAPEDKNGTNPYSSVIVSIDDKLNELHTLQTMLQRVVMSDAQGNISAGTASSTTEISKTGDALLSIKNKWPALPTNEEQALRRAIDAFDYSYNHENYFQSIEQSMSVVTLIVDLQSRVGEHLAALRYVGEIYKSGMNNKQELDRRVKQGRKSNTLSPHDERMIRRKIGNINIAIRQAGESRRQLISLMIDMNKKIIDKVISNYADASSQEQQKALVQAGIPEELIPELKSRKIIKEEKKKGLFG